jgi:hypothetical protein
MSYAPERRCSREGCSRRANGGRDTSSALCTAVVAEMASAQRVTEAIGGAGELWASAVGLNDAVSAFRSADAEVYSAARRVGFTSQQLRAIKRGAVAG